MLRRRFRSRDDVRTSLGFRRHRGLRLMSSQPDEIDLQPPPGPSGDRLAFGAESFLGLTNAPGRSMRQVRARFGSHAIRGTSGGLVSSHPCRRSSGSGRRAPGGGKGPKAQRGTASDLVSSWFALPVFIFYALLQRERRWLPALFPVKLGANIGPRQADRRPAPERGFSARTD